MNFEYMSMILLKLVNRLIFYFILLTIIGLSQKKDSLTKLKVLLTYNLDFFITGSSISTKNILESYEPDNFHFYYYINTNNRLKIGKFKISSYFFNEFGLRSYRDSITTISEDVFNFKNSVSLPLKNSNFDFNFSVSTKSQFWKHYNYSFDNDTIIKFLYTDYLSPGYKVYSGGFRYNFLTFSSIEFGLASGRKTVIKNQNIFDQRNAKKLYGLEKGRYSLTNFGFNLILNISPTKIFKNFYFENFAQIFISKDSFFRFNSYNVDINNSVHYILLKYIRLTLRTKFLYDRIIYIKPIIVNQFVIGFYLNNKI